MWSLAVCDATTRFCKSVETDFSNSQAKTGAAAKVRNAAAANRLTDGSFAISCGGLASRRLGASRRVRPGASCAYTDCRCMGRQVDSVRPGRMYSVPSMGLLSRQERRRHEKPGADSFDY